MKDSWTCRDYREGDERAILRLYNEVNDRDMPAAYWRWRYTRSPFGPGIIKLLFADEKLIGHYALTPMDVSVDDRPLRAVFSLHTMTHPAFQKQGIFSFLAEEAYGRCQSEGFSFVYGFPNENSYHGFTNRLGWVGFGKMSCLEKNLGGLRGALEVDNVDEVEAFDERVDLLWHKVKSGYRVAVPRTQDYLNWRFGEHPTVAYPKYTVSSGPAEIAGYMILKVYSGDKEPRGHVIDMLCIDDHEVVKGLLNCAYVYFIANGVRRLSCWMPDDCFCAEILRRQDFVRKPFDAHFGVRVFNREDALLQAIEEPRNWHLTMGDSDVF